MMTDDSPQEDETVKIKEPMVVGDTPTVAPKSSIQTGDMVKGPYDKEQHHETEPYPDDDTLAPLCGLVPDFYTVLRLGMMACRYGAVGYMVEAYLTEVLEMLGYNGTAVVTNTDLQFSVYREATPRNTDNDEESLPQTAPTANVQLPFTVNVTLENHNDFSKLIDLSVICADLVNNHIDLGETKRQLKELEARRPPWSPFVQFVSYVTTSPAFVATLKGGWTDIWLGLLGGILTFCSIRLFDWKWPTKKKSFGMFVAAMLPAILATGASLSKHLKVNVVAVTIGSIISEVPGFPTAIGVSELSRNRILAGLGHWIKAFLVAIWLGLGAWIGMLITLAIAGKDQDDLSSEDNPISQYWYFLVAPVLGVCFSISFTVGCSELPMSILVCIIAFCMSLSIEHFPDDNLGTVVASFVTTIAAQIWGRSWLAYLFCGKKNAAPNPSIIVLLPAFFILVGGSIGVRGFAILLSGETEDGETTLLQFILVPVLLVIGIFLGESLIPSASVLHGY